MLLSTFEAATVPLDVIAFVEDVQAIECLHHHCQLMAVQEHSEMHIDLLTSHFR